MTTAILVLSVDEAGWLERSLPAAAAQPDAFVVVIDNACTDATAGVAARAGARVVRLDERLSYARAINAGFAAVGDCDAVLLLNADCVLEPGFLAAARAPLAGDPSLGSVAPRLIRLDPSGAPLERLDTAGMVVDRRRKNGLVGHDAPVASFMVGGPCFGGDGACVLYRRACLDACLVDGELLDPDLELWASDVDLAWRAQLLGWRSWYEPSAVAFHKRFYSPSTRSLLSEEHRRLQFRNRYLMMVKNDTASGLLRALPWVAVYEVLAFGHVLLRERFLLRGYADVWRLRRAAHARRRIVQSRRAASPPFGLRPPQ